MRHAIAFLLLVGVAATSAALENRPAPRPGAENLPLLTWEMLTQTFYDPRTPTEYPANVEALAGKKVRMEGYLMPRYESQDPEDMFLTGINPTSLFCGPSDMTLLVDLHLPGFEYEEWPTLPVEITGTFLISRRTQNMRPIYMFLGDSWRPLRVWEQEFPGVVTPERVGPDLDGD